MKVHSRFCTSVFRPVHTSLKYNPCLIKKYHFKPLFQSDMNGLDT